MKPFPDDKFPDNLVIPRADRDYRIGMKAFPDHPMNRFRIVSFIHDATIRLQVLGHCRNNFSAWPVSWTLLFKATNPVSTCCSASTESEVFKGCFRILPVRSEKYWLQYPLVNPEESIAVMGIFSSEV